MSLRKNPNIIYFILVNLAFSFGNAISSPAREQEYTDGIVAVVNDEVITVYDVAEYNAEFERNLKKSIAGLDLDDNAKHQKLVNEINVHRIKAAHNLVNEKLIYAEFKTKGYQFPEELVDKRIDSIVMSYTGGDRGKFEEMLLESNTSITKFREKIKRKLAVDLLINQSIDRNIKISPYEVETYYKENIDKYSEPSRVLLQIIMVIPDELNNREEFEKRVKTISDEIKNGVDFSELAKQYSHDPSKKNGGELGWLDKSDIRIEFKDALGEIKKGAVSDHLILNGSTYFVKVADLTEGITHPVGDVYDEIKKNLYRTAKKKRYESYIEELRSKAYIRIFFQE